MLPVKKKVNSNLNSWTISRIIYKLGRNIFTNFQNLQKVYVFIIPFDPVSLMKPRIFFGGFQVVLASSNWVFFKFQSIEKLIKMIKFFLFKLMRNFVRTLTSSLTVLAPFLANKSLFPTTLNFLSTYIDLTVFKLT